MGAAATISLPRTSRPGLAGRDPVWSWGFGGRLNFLCAASQRRSLSSLAVNTAHGNINTSTFGTYQAFAITKYAKSYLWQIQYLFNRRFDLRSVLIRLARSVCLTLVHPLYTTRAAELSC